MQLLFIANAGTFIIVFKKTVLVVFSNPMQFSEYLSLAAFTCNKLLFVFNFSLCN